MIARDRKFLIVSEAAEYLRVSEVTLLRWVKSGLVKGFRRGARWRFDIEDLDRWGQEAIASDREKADNDRKQAV